MTEKIRAIPTHLNRPDNYPLSIIHYPLSIIHYPLSIIHYPLSIIHYPLSIIHYPLSIIHYPLPFMQRKPHRNGHPDPHSPAVLHSCDVLRIHRDARRLLVEHRLIRRRFGHLPDLTHLRRIGRGDWRGRRQLHHVGDDLAALRARLLAINSHPR